MSTSSDTEREKEREREEGTTGIAGCPVAIFFLFPPRGDLFCARSRIQWTGIIEKLIPSRKQPFKKHRIAGENVQIRTYAFTTGSRQSERSSDGERTRANLFQRAWRSLRWTLRSSRSNSDKQLRVFTDACRQHLFCSFGQKKFIWVTQSCADQTNTNERLAQSLRTISPV